MSTLMSQNIFDYATSELSQDAFISLMIGWFDSENNNLQELSRDFISQLYFEYHKEILKNPHLNLTIQSVLKKQQYHKIDVFFEITTKENDIIPFIIEDKTWTEPHSDQLQRYVKKINNPKTIKIFFKTGHITEKDINETQKAQYLIIDTHWIYHFLLSYKNKISNTIFKDYLNYLERNFYSKLYDMDDGDKLTLKDWEAKNVKEGYVQYALLASIKNKIKNPNYNYIKYTRNGKRWDTWWTFYNNDEYKFFIKIANIRKKYRLRFIAYSNTKEFQPTLKSENIKIYQDILESIKTNFNIQNLQNTKKPLNKARETEISYFEIEDNLEQLSNQSSKAIQEFIEQLDGL